MVTDDVLALFQACKAGDRERVRALLDAAVPVNARAHLGDHYSSEERAFTALDYAVRHGHADVARLLLERGAAPTALALHLAARRGHTEAVRLLLDWGAAPDATSGSPTPPERMRDGTVIYFYPVDGTISHTPLMLAAAGGHADVARLLLERGADPRRRHPGGPDEDDSALVFAARGGHAAVVRLLLQCGAGESRGEREQALDRAVRVRGGSPEALGALLEAGADLSGERGASLVIAAAYKAYVNILRLLLDAGVTLSLAQLDAALFQVASSFRYLIDDEPKQDERGALDLLFERCALPLLEGGALPPSGREAGLLLTLAARHGRADLADRLLALRPPVPLDVPDERGADFPFCERPGGTPLLYAAARQDTRLATRLLEHGARGKDQSERWRVLRTGDADCSTALAKAAANGDVAMLSLLLEWGEDVEIRPPGESGREAGYTGLHAAAKHGQLEAAAFLLGRGADVNARCVGGQTPLMLSAKWADTRLAGLLLRHGTDVGLRDAQGSTALQHAAETSSDLVRLLREHGAEADTRDRKRRGRPLSGP